MEATLDRLKIGILGLSQIAGTAFSCNIGKGLIRSRLFSAALELGREGSLIPLVWTSCS